jgi:aerobic-type carbon monoxide dehydrogenase small subunit (CoxS/CutS family)
MPTPEVPPEALHGVTVTVNGRAETLEVPARRSLLHALREDLSLTGTKEGCGVGTCGACTVLLDGRPVLACLLLAVQAAGRSVETIESLSRDGGLAPIQETFVRHDALQCGFCTPGQIMALEGLLRRTPHPSDETVRRALEGNVCRCGTQLRVQAAARELAGAASAAGPAGRRTG